MSEKGRHSERKTSGHYIATFNSITSSFALIQFYSFYVMISELFTARTHVMALLLVLVVREGILGCIQSEFIWTLGGGR